MFQAKRRSTDPTPSPSRNRLLPKLEALEDRAVPAVIAGCVYADLNGNGLRDPGEAPIASSSIELRNASGVVIGTTVTDAQGMYEFSLDQSVSTAPSLRAQEVTFDLAQTDLTRSGKIGRAHV